MSLFSAASDALEAARRLLDSRPDQVMRYGPTIQRFLQDDHPLILLRAPNQVGKALQDDEPVLTPTGWVRIADLRVGDAVVAGDGSVTRVTGVYPQGIQPLFRLTFDGGEVHSVCTADHLWLVKTPESRFSRDPRKRGSWEVKSLQSIIDYAGLHPAPLKRHVIPSVGAVSERVLYHIEPAGEGPATCISVAHQDQTFVTRDFIVTHNTVSGAARANRFSLERPGSLGLVVVADLENHYPEICAKIREAIARSELDPRCKYTEGKGYMIHGRRGILYRNGSRWTFRSGKGEMMALAGITVNWVWIDEIPQRGHFGEALRAAQRHLAPVWLTFTPIGRPVAWLRRRIEGDPDTGAPPEDCNPDGTPAWRQYVPKLTAVECPWLTRDQIAAIRARVDADEAPQRLEGEWEGPTPGRVFSGMRSALVETSMPVGNWTVTVSIDHGEAIGRQHATLLFGAPGRVLVVDEYRNETATTPEQDADGIVSMLARHGLHPLSVDKWIGDVNSLGKLGAGRSVNAELARAIGAKIRAPHLIRIETPDKRPGSVDFGRRLLNYALHRGDLTFLPEAKHTIRAVWHHRGGQDDHTHAIDALRYGAVPHLQGAPEYSSIVWRVSGS